MVLSGFNKIKIKSFLRISYSELMNQPNFDQINHLPLNTPGVSQGYNQLTGAANSTNHRNATGAFVGSAGSSSNSWVPQQWGNNFHQQAPPQDQQTQNPTEQVRAPSSSSSSSTAAVLTQSQQQQHYPKEMLSDVYGSLMDPSATDFGDLSTMFGHFS